MAKGQEELVVITRAYDLSRWSCHHAARFPRSHRFVLGERELWRLHAEPAAKSYQPGAYCAFVIREPKPRRSAPPRTATVSSTTP
jgi:hypothetical protein